ncbi:CRISPR-associated helicase Cas3', partial [bacterium]|nr:CRISPR-associated helicase Cas3' [bacterium]
MEFYAHSLPDQPKDHWQKLKQHLKNVADKASSFAGTFKAENWAYLAGILHDLGKYQEDFQKYLIEGGRRGSAPHAVWGAAYARRLSMPEIAFVIDGHHKGLPNKADLSDTTEKFKRNDVKNFQSVIDSFLKDVNYTEKDLKCSLHPFDNSLQREFFIRYIFSALIDADWLDTEAHFDPDKSQDRISLNLPIEEMIEKLAKELSNKPKDGAINLLRNQARKSALQKADSACGFYSLNLPTGLGKTLISIVWALHHAKANRLKRIFVVLPYVNIIDQTVEELKKIFGDEWVLEHHSSYNESAEEKSDNGNYEDVSKKRKLLSCENWDYPIIVTTTVQFFESLFSNKTSKCRKIHNIAESVVIFDEVQTFPKEILLPTITMLKNIQAVMRTSFLFCTATQPAFEKRENFDGIDSIQPLIDNPTEFFKKTRRVDFGFLDNLIPIRIDKLFTTVKETDSSALIIFNTKKAVMEFFNQAIQEQESWEKCYHLSTAMCPEHRRNTIKDIRDDLKDKRKILVVSTQLIEAGVDFDFPCVFRAFAPLESIIQSAGRCNREGKMPVKGKVYLFQLEGGAMPDRTYRACAEHTKNLLQTDINKLYRHEFYSEYYSHVINLFVDVDKNNIINAQNNLNFETVNDSYSPNYSY